MRYFRRHANTLVQRGVRVNGFAYVYCVCSHLDSESNLADHAAAKDFSVAVGFGAVVKQQFDHAFVTAISYDLNVYVDETAICDGCACFVSSDFFTIGGAAYGL